MSVDAFHVAQKGHFLSPKVPPVVSGDKEVCPLRFHPVREREKRAFCSPLRSQASQARARTTLFVPAPEEEEVNRHYASKSLSPPLLCSSSGR